MNKAETKVRKRGHTHNRIRSNSFRVADRISSPARRARAYSCARASIVRAFKIYEDNEFEAHVVSHGHATRK